MNTKNITNYKPKDFAELLGVSVKTLQRWDREGILKANRTPTDRRYYTYDQYLEFKGIKKDKDIRDIVIYARVSTKNQKDEQVKVGKIQALLNPFTYLIVNFAIIIIIYASGCQVNVGSLSQGEVIALINYMNSILQALIVFANVLSIYNKATASYQRVFEVLETTPQVEDQGSYSTLIPNEKMIEYKKLMKRIAFGSECNDEH